MNDKQRTKYKQDMDMILKYGGTYEEQLNQFIQLVEDILSEN